MTRAEAFDALQEAYAARDDARERAVQEVERQFAGIIKRRLQDYHDAMMREGLR